MLPLVRPRAAPLGAGSLIAILAAHSGPSPMPTVDHARPNRSPAYGTWLERGTVALFGFAASIWVWTLAQRLGPIIYLAVSWDAWFDADPIRTFENITQRTSLLLRSALHPLAGALARAPFVLIHALTRLSGYRGAQLELALVGGGVVVAFVALLRCIGCRRREALLLGGLLSTSAAFVVFAPIPETFGFGALTTLAALTLVVRAPEGWKGDVACGGALALASAATATNILTPLAAVIVLRRWRTWLRIGLAAVVFLAAGTALQAGLFPLANTWPAQIAEGLAVARQRPNEVVSGDLVPVQDLPHVGRVIRAFFVHSLVLPDPTVGRRAAAELTLVPSPLPTLGVQTSSFDRFSPLALTALAGWSGIGLLAALGVLRRKADRVDGILAAAVVAQLTLHVFIGRETILYALHFTPILVALAGRLSMSGGPTRPALALVGITALLTGTSNWQTFARSADLLHDSARGVDLASAVPVRSRPPFEVSTAERTLSLPDLPVTVELGCEGGGCRPKVGAPLRALEFEPRVWSVLARVREAGRSGLQLHVAADPATTGSAASPPWLRSEEAAIVLLRHRWIVAFYPNPIGIELKNQPGETCGDLMAPCFTVDLAPGKAWRIAIADALVKPAWQGMGPLSDPRVWPTLHVHRRSGESARSADTGNEKASETEDQIGEASDRGGSEEDRAIDRPVGIGTLPLQPSLGPNGESSGVKGTTGDEWDR